VDKTLQAGRGGGKPAGVRRREVVMSSGNGGGTEVTARQAAPSVEGRDGSCRVPVRRCAE
jgi:hypothetical protein